MSEGMVDGKRSRGKPEKSGVTIIIEWTGIKVVELIKTARDREACKNVAEQSAFVSQRPDGFKGL